MKAEVLKFFMSNHRLGTGPMGRGGRGSRVYGKCRERASRDTQKGSRSGRRRTEGGSDM